MTERLDDVWATRDFPVLVEVTRRIDAGEPGVLVDVVAATLGVPASEVKLAGAALERRGLVVVKGAWGDNVLSFTAVSGEAYFLTGLHPNGDDAVSALVDALRQAADLSPDPGEKSRLRALADGALGVGRDVLGGVLVSLATKGVLG